MIKKNFFINSTLILLIFLLDRISKIYVIFLDNKLAGSEIFSSKYLNINLIWNEGIAFGLFSFSQSNLYNLITLIIVIIIFIILILIKKTKGVERFCLSLVFGGALGNFYDRIVHKAVPDFIDFHIRDLHWFIFNVADIFITLGVIMLILLELIKTKKNNE
ncbi:signal peptidase II [Candidatus Pelagibacter sp.]|nr:signal peptidase II [Candidatus Pelagibacter sp.]